MGRQEEYCSYGILIYNTYMGLWVLCFYWLWIIEWEISFAYSYMVLRRRKYDLQKQLMYHSKAMNIPIRESVIERIVETENDMEDLQIKKEEAFYRYLVPLQKRFSSVVN